MGEAISASNGGCPDSPDRDPSSPPLWRSRSFLALWTIEGISDAVQHAVWYGIVLLVLQRSDSATLMALAVATLLVPGVIVTLPAGALLDRSDTRQVLIWVNALRALLAVAYAILAAADALPLALLLLTNVVYASVNQLFSAAEETMLPAVVPRERLMEANGVFHLTYSMAQLSGFVILGPALARLAGLGWVFLIAGLAIAGCALLALQLPADERRPRTQGPLKSPREVARALLEDLGLAFRYLRDTRGLLWTMACWTLAAATGLVVATLAPSFGERVLEMPREDAIFLLAPAGVGLVGATLLLSGPGKRWNRPRVMVLGMSAAAVGLVALGGGAWLAWWLSDGPPARLALPLGVETSALTPPVMVVSILIGGAIVAIMLPAQTLLQERVPEVLRGRIFSLQLLMGNLASLLPLLAMGVLADVIGPARTLLLLGLLVSVVAALARRHLAEPRIGTTDRPD